MKPQVPRGHLKTPTPDSPVLAVAEAGGCESWDVAAGGCESCDTCWSSWESLDGSGVGPADRNSRSHEHWAGVKGGSGSLGVAIRGDRNAKLEVQRKRAILSLPICCQRCKLQCCHMQYTWRMRTRLALHACALIAACRCVWLLLVNCV